MRTSFGKALTEVGGDGFHRKAGHDLEYGGRLAGEDRIGGLHRLGTLV